MKRKSMLHRWKAGGRYLVGCLLLCCLFLETHAQEQQLKGRVVAVKDKTPLAGVTVHVKGTQNGTVTDVNGNFSLSAAPDAVLEASYVGYLNKEVPVNSQTDITISLAENIRELNDVVVVGYGTQKKVNLTGAISTLDMSEKAGEPTTNASNALAGMPGMFLKLGQNQPGLDRSQIRIRGMGTLSGNDPLILVDGIEYSIDELNPDDIESVTVLKDASAAIYGSRAANGVILITTKSGAGKSHVNYNYYYGVQSPTIMPDVIWDPIAYMKLKNQAVLNGGTEIPNYSDEEIAEYEAGMKTDPFTYPANDWFDIALKKGRIQKHNLSFSGSSDNYQYRLSLGFLNRQGIIIGPNDKEQKYSLGLNTSLNVSKRLKVGLTFNGYYRYYNEPYYSGDGGDFFKDLMRALPIFTDTLKDGRYGDSWLSTPGRNNIENPRMIAETGYFHKVVQRFLATTFAEYKLPWDITYNIRFGVDKYDGLQEKFTPQVKHYNPKTGKATNWNSPATAPRSTNTDYNDMNIHFYNTLDWHRQFARKHNLAVMLGASYDYFDHGQFAAEMIGYLDATLTALDAGSVRNAISGYTNEDVLESYFGRVNYDYDGKYLFEATFRYDGSSRFAPGRRWGFFPSASAGWRIDKESFFQSSLIDLLKLRASIGQLGNQAVDLYSYENSITLNHDYSFGGVLAPGAAATAYSDPLTSWETTTDYDLGLDVDLWKNRINITADVYKKRTKDILRTVDLPSQVGLTGPKENVGTVDNTGYELAVQYRNTIGAFHYGVQGNISYNKNKVIDLGGQILYDEQTNLSTITLAGHPIDAHYLLVSEGIFQTQEEVDAHAYQSEATRPGYLKYKDVNGDNIINGDDRVIIDESSAIPKYTYGFGLNVGYKGISLKAFFQGIAGIKVYPVGNIAYPFNNGAGATKQWLTDAWTPDNPDARLPIVTESTGGKDNFLQSDFWLQSGAYLRLKSLQLAYALPQKWLSKVKIAQLSVFLNAENFLTFTKYKDFDPETISNYSSLYHYPNLKTFSGGVNVSF
ncbi:TonB-dependent receptor [Compostibacter hankyongensis]|uniref:TonB-dependent receptor n=1 Tax=Compostibacter hankyongensis TaxID=1007089 RepID=A0ABP8FS39_9BACT